MQHYSPRPRRASFHSHRGMPRCIYCVCKSKRPPFYWKYSYLRPDAGGDLDCGYTVRVCQRGIGYLLLSHPLRYGDFVHIPVFPVGDGEYNGILGRSFVDELNALAATTSANTPLMMVMEGDTVAAYVGKTRSVLFEYPAGTFAEDNMTMTAEEMTLITPTQTVVNATQTYSDVTYQYTVPTVELSAVVPPIDYMNSLEIDMDFDVQGGNSWSAAYVTAIIIRYINKAKDDQTTAISIMLYTHPTTHSVHQSLSRSELATYAAYRNITYTEVDSAITTSVAIREIDNNRPVYLSMSCICHEDDSEVHSRHAICLYGYNTRFQTYDVWNPWYSTGEYMPQGGVYETSANKTHNQYVCTGYICNWQQVGD